MLILTVLLCGCSGGSRGVDPAADSITLATATEPPSLNSLRATDAESAFVLAHIMEGLAQYDQHGRLVPGVASRWRVDADGATFWLRPGARWSDGVSVTAKDFVFAWRTALDPATASPYASILYCIRNARAINAGKLAPTELGATAVGDHRIEVRFERACPYFASLTAFMTYLPIRADIYHRYGERYAADAGTMVFNGPYVLARWVHGASLRFQRNPDYHGIAPAAIATIDVPYITSDPGAMLNLFRDGQIAMAGLDTEAFASAQREGLPVRRFRDGSIYFIEYNFRDGRPTRNAALRRAIRLVFSSDTLVDKVIAVPGYRPLYGLFPSTAKEGARLFRNRHPLAPPQPDLAAAREAVARARRQLGGQIPELTLLVSESPLSVKIADYLQQLLHQSLGLDVHLEKQIFKERIARMRRGEFDLVLTGWGPDYDDPLTYGDLFASWNENNRGRFTDADYDRWVAVAQNSADPQVRDNAFVHLEQIVMRDQVILPLFEGATVYVQDRRLVDVGREIYGGDPNFKFARIVGAGDGDIR